jgi:predicted AlkP superfamily pyrophosphatase or phosphodiesterase
MIALLHQNHITKKENSYMSKVVLIMTDGLRPDAINETYTPNLVKFMARGASTLNASSVMPSVTLPCHTSIFHSVPPSRHGIVENVWHPFARPLPGLVEQLKIHDKRSSFIFNWEQLRDLSRPGNLYNSYFKATGDDIDGDEWTLKTALEYFSSTITDFTFLYFATTDVAGHAYGWMSDGYLQQATVVDGFLQQVLDVMPDDVTVIIQSDHGGHERTHGTEMPEDMTIPWMMAGPNVKQNYRIERPVSLLDTAPTVVHLLGVPAYSAWEGTAVTEALG